MKYTRPEVLLTADSVTAIRGSSCKHGIYLECNGSAYNESAAAYEANE